MFRYLRVNVLVLVLAGVHAAAQRVARGPEGGVEVGLLDGHAKRSLKKERGGRCAKKPAMPGNMRGAVDGWRPRQESNLHLALRRRPFYPLNYGGGGCGDCIGAGGVPCYARRF